MKSKILIIDDETAILNALQIFLEQEGYEVRAVDKYDDYFKKHEGELPDIIILDIILLDEDGREVARQLKSSDQTKHIPIIMISAHLVTYIILKLVLPKGMTKPAILVVQS